MSAPSGISTPGAATGFANLESIFGPLIIGVILSAVLWGVCCIQTYDYYMTPNDDHLWQKLVVAFLWVLDTFDTAMGTDTLYYYLVKNFGQPNVLLSPAWSTSCRALLNGFSSFVVQAMFTRRIYLLSRKNRILTFWIIAMSTAQFVAAILVTAKALMGLQSEPLPKITLLMHLSFSLRLACDVSVTLALSWLLHSVKTGIRKTDSIVKTLILYIVTTGLLVVIDAILALIFYNAMPQNLVYMGFYLVLGKLYINAFLASLNARDKLRKGQTDVAISLSRMHYQPRDNTKQTTVTTDDDETSFNRSDNPMAIASQTSMANQYHDVKNVSSADVV